MKTTKTGSIIDMDVFPAMDHVNEQKEALWTAWMSNGHQDFERILRMAIQEVEALKNQHTELNISVPYVLGKLDGYTELFEGLYRAEQRMHAIAEDLTPQTRQILLYLYENGGTQHGDLAAAIDSSYNSLTNTMKTVLLSGAVEAECSGQNMRYHLTEAGKQYCENILSAS